MTSSTPVIPDWLKTLPKVELHVHLEGTITPDRLWALALKNDIDLGIGSPREVAQIFEYDDFPGFIRTFTKCSTAIQTCDDLAILVTDYGEELASQRVRYAELHVNFEPHWRWLGLSYKDQLDAINEARTSVLERHGIELRWIADGIRDAQPGPISATRTVDMMIAAGPDSGIVALGLGGDEQIGPAHRFIEPFFRAREAGFHVVAHAGEGAGPESIRASIELLGAERIGHGIRAIEDPAVIQLLIDRGIPLEVCPTSNVCTGLVESIGQHPLRTLADAGIQFSIGSDDPPMFHTDLTTELAITAQLLDLDRHAVARLMSEAIAQSFAPAELKAEMQKELRDHTPVDQEQATASINSR